MYNTGGDIGDGGWDFLLSDSKRLVSTNSHEKVTQSPFARAPISVYLRSACKRGAHSETRHQKGAISRGANFIISLFRHNGLQNQNIKQAGYQACINLFEIVVQLFKIYYSRLINEESSHRSNYAVFVAFNYHEPLSFVHVSFH